MTSMPGRLRAPVAVGLIVALLAPSAYAQSKLKPYTWAEVQSLPMGKEITLTFAGSPPARVRVWYVDDATLFTSPPTKPPKLPQRVKDWLPAMGENWTKVIKGEEFRDGSIRIVRDGVFDGTTKLAELTQVVQIVFRDRAGTIEIEEHSHKSRRIVLVVVGVVLLIVAIWGYSQ